METINNLAAAATKAVWGEQNTPQSTTQNNETAGKEPISGQQGKGTANEPFDQGNSEDAMATATSTANTNKAPSNTDTYTPTPEPASNPSETSPSMSESAPTYNPNNAAQGGEPDPHQNTDKTGVTAGRTGDARKAEDIIPSERASNPGAAPASGAAPMAKHQGADMPNDAPSDHQEKAINEKTEDAEDFLKTRDPNDHSGEPMHMHDGSENSAPQTQEERRTSKVGNPGGQEHGTEPKGTGEQWVKTTGTAADGGDFDATKPGAGREADRLLEEKGIKKTTSGTVAEPNDTTQAGGHKEKESIGDKLKNKLHIGHKQK